MVSDRSRSPLRSSLGPCLAVAAALIGLSLLWPGMASSQTPEPAKPGAEKTTQKDKPNGKAQAPAADPLETPKLATEKAPEKFRVAFETTTGPFVVEVVRAWSPNGADRFYNLVKIGFFDEIAFFRVIDGFMVQFGIHGDPAISRVWKRATIKDDPVVESNRRGMLSFAKTNRPNSRTTQIFINFSDNTNLDRMGFSPFARVVEGMEAVDEIYKIGEGAPRGKGPNQQRIQSQGNTFLKANYPKLDYIKGARILD